MTRVGRWSWCVGIVMACLALAADQPSSAQAPFDPSRYPALADNPKFQRLLWEFQQRAYGLGTIPQDAKERALATIAQIAAAPPTPATLTQGAVPTNGIWQNVGPAPITSGAATFSGRVTAIAVDPSDSNHWLIGGAQGGVWETTDGGTNWAPRTDSKVSLAMGALAFSASNPDIVYAGTGEGSFSGDSYAGGGLLKSTDGGTSWSLLAAATFAKSGFNAIRVDPTNADVLVAASTRGIAGKLASFPPLPLRGIFRSTDGGSTWSRRLAGEATDIAVNPANFSQQYGGIGDNFQAAANGVYRSLDGGVTWNPIAGPWTGLSGGVGRVALAIAPSNANVLYVSIQDVFSSPSQPNDGRLLGLWVTSDAWSATPTWTAIDATPASGYCSSQCWYDHVLSVDPANPSILYAGGVGLWKFNGTTWTNVTTGIHVDQHAMAWVGSRFIVGNDGGVFSTINGGTSWTSHNTNLAITQFYAGSLHPSNGDFALGGTQDNGTDKWTGASSWPTVFGGDGGYSAFSSSAPNTNWAVTTQNLGIWRTTNGAGFAAADAGITKSGAIFIAPIVKCPSSDDTILAAAAVLWKTTNFFTSAPSAPTWSANSPSFGGSITTIAFAPSDATCNTYAIGTSTGLMRLTTNGGATWADIDALNAVPSRPISSLAFHPLDPNLLYAAVSGFDEATPSQPGHVFTTSNALAPTPGWSNISPPVNLPANSVAASSSQPAGLYVGSDIGVWTSANGGGAWTFLGPAQGMPNVAVFDVKIDETTGRVMAFTHGRGAFVLNAPAPEAISVTPNSGSGAAQTFSAVYSDSLGAADLAQVFVRFSADLSSPASSCIVRYTQSTHLLSLRDDAGVWQPGLPLPGGGVLQNSQCAVDVGASSVSMAGNTLTLNAAMTFTLSYGGLKNTYLNAVSALGPGTGFVLRGTWTVPSAAIDAISVSPNAGAGITQLFTLAYSDSAGVAADLKRAMVRFGASTLNACVVDYNAIAATVRLFDDSGVPGSPATLGNPGTLSNSQCSLDLATSSATPNGNDLTLALKITFLPAFAGPASISMRAQSVSGSNTGWLPKGSWTAGAILDAVSITPNSGTGMLKTFTAVFSDSLGVTTDLKRAMVRFGASTVNGCVIDYNAITNTVRLFDDAGIPGSPVPFGSGSVLVNSQCDLFLGSSTATPGGTTLTLDLRILFKPPFLGTQPIALRANSNFGVTTTGWLARGTWDVNAAVQAISVTPSNGSGSAQTFALAYSDGEGVSADLKAARVRIQDAGGGPQCLIDYNAMTNLVRVMADDLVTWSSAFTPGTVKTIDNNSQCSLDVGQSSAAPSGTSLTLTLRVIFKTAFAGAKSIAMRANSNVGSTTGWIQRGTFTVTGPAPSGDPFRWPYNQPTSISFDPAQVLQAWQEWKAAQITSTNAGGNGRLRVMGGVDNTSTVSEGQGYGILFASIFDDQATVDGLWLFTSDHLNVRGLMDWYIGNPGQRLGTGAATDGDEDMALGLLNACIKVQRGSWPASPAGINYCARATSLIAAIYQYEIDKPGIDPPAGLPNNPGNELLPGDQWNTAFNYPQGIINLSYFAPGYYSAFGKFAGTQSAWSAVNTRNYAVLNLAQGQPGNCSKLVPNWVRYDGVAQPVPWQPTNYAWWSYDAARLAWRAAVDRAWYGTADARATVNEIGSFFSSVGMNGIGEHSMDGQRTASGPWPFFVANAAAAIWASDSLTPVTCGAATGSLKETKQSAYDRVVATKDMPNSYYGNAWRLFAMLLMTGNFPNFVEMAANYDGTWSGTTSGLQNVFMTVANGRITAFDTQVHYTGTNCSGNTLVSLLIPATISNGSASLLLSAVGGSGSGSATFSSPTTMSGFLSINVINCPTSIGTATFSLTKN